MSRFPLLVSAFYLFPYSVAFAQPVGQGELRILGPGGAVAGFCPLKHTDVAADVAGLFSRVTVRQEFHNTSPDKIEAIYVFPLPQNAAVEDMTLTVGDRTIRGLIKERSEARQIYEQAKAAGHVTALLDQERPNIFTQSVANIEPGERVVIEISYVDVLKYEDGRYEFMFPMVVGPRYITGQPAETPKRHGWAKNTDKVPDASKITPPVAPKGQRAGHDISLRVTLDAGMPIVELASPSHEVDAVRDARGRATITLKDQESIPNKDFVLHYRTQAEGIGDALLTHTDARGGYFTLVLEPPARVDANAVVPRELIFVLDTSGSMMGTPIEKAKAVMSRALDAMRAGDTFNVITFSGDTNILWPALRPALQANREEAQQFLATRRGRGGTEMMKAINAALMQRCEIASWVTADELANLPADGRAVRVRMERRRIEKIADPGVSRGLIHLHMEKGGTIQACAGEWAAFDDLFARSHDRDWLLEGRWSTQNGERWLQLDRATSPAQISHVPPMRIAVFMTDGYVGNDLEIIDAIRKHAATTRVFSMGIGTSVNRFLLDGMARAGRGEVQYVLGGEDADAAVKQLTSRIETPVLSDISMDWGIAPVTDVRPAMISDLFSAKPVVIHGRYQGAYRGTIRLRGLTGAGPMERSIDVDLPGAGVQHPALASLWARAKVSDVLDRDLSGLQRGAVNAEVRKEVLGLGLEYAILTPFTSFVAVEEMRITVGGEAKTIAVPVEMPEGVSHEGVFGDGFAGRKGGGLFGGGGGRGGPQRLRQPAGKYSARPAEARSDDDGEKGDHGSAVDQPVERIAPELKELAKAYARQGNKGELKQGGIVVRAGKLEVMIVLKDQSDKSLAALKALGVEILSQSRSVRMVVVRIELAKLDAIAALDAVVRIEPIR